MKTNRQVVMPEEDYGAPDIVELQQGDSLVTLCPEAGGAIARFSWRGRQILRAASDDAICERRVRQMGCYPLVPYSNRIGNAELIAARQRYRLRANSPPEPHALHGFGWQRAWNLHSQTGTSAELRLAHRPDVDWPFACEARQIVELDADTLHLRLVLKNTDQRPMPAGLGFHPYFSVQAGTRLQAYWKKRWAMGADRLPTGREPVPREADFRQPRALAGWQTDHCFSGWNRRALLAYRSHNVCLEASSACVQIVCFSPGGQSDFIALEPVTHVNNAFQLAAESFRGTGARLLAKGKTLEMAISIRAYR